jgi:diacylglycerol kinase family enzyme
MPYFYLYDTYLGDRSYASLLIKLETTLTDLGLQGKISQLTLLKSVRDLITAAVRDGADTVVAVGNNLTLSRVAEVVAKYPKVTVGFVPLGSEHQTCAELLGIPIGLLSCHVLSSRLVETVTLGQVNNQYFLQAVECSGQPVLECAYGGKTYQITLEAPHRVKVCNLDHAPEQTGLETTGQLDHALATVLAPETKRGWFGFGKPGGTSTTVIPTETVIISSMDDELALTVDGYRTIKTPATIRVAKERLKLIVGKKRLF